MYTATSAGPARTRAAASPMTETPSPCVNRLLNAAAQRIAQPCSRFRAEASGKPELVRLGLDRRSRPVTGGVHAASAPRHSAARRCAAVRGTVPWSVANLRGQNEIRDLAHGA